MCLNGAIMEKASVWSSRVPRHELKKEQDADCESKQQVSLLTSTYQCTATPSTTSPAHSTPSRCLVHAAILKWPSGSCPHDVQHSLWGRGVKLFGVCCRSTSQNRSPCPGAERGDLSQASPAARTSQSSWIIKQWSSLPWLCIPNTCCSKRKGRKLVWTTRKFSQGKFYSSKIAIFSGIKEQQFLFHLPCCLCILGKKCLSSKWPDR